MKPVVLPTDADIRLYFGVAGPAVPAVSANLLTANGKPPQVTVLLGPAGRTLEAWAEDLEFFFRRQKPKANLRVLSLPNLGDFEEDDARAFELSCDRLAALSALVAPKPGEHICLAVHPGALLQHVPQPKQLKTASVRLKVGEQVNFQGLIDKLNNELGYDSEAICETPGQFAVRGGLIDIYPLNATAPLRIDFFGDEIDAIQEFDPTSQRSGDSVKEALLSPAIESSSTDQSTLLDYLPKKVTWLIREPRQLAEDAPELFQYPENIPPPSRNLKHLMDARAGKADQWFALAELDLDHPLLGDSPQREEVVSEALEPYVTFAESNQLGVIRQESEQRSRRDFLHQILQWHKRGHQVHFVLKTEAEERRLREMLTEDPSGKQLKANCIIAGLSEGFRLALPERQEVFVTEAELFGRKRIRVGRRQRKMPHRQAVDQALDFSELADGDYLVHLQNGVCMFRGLQKLKVGQREEEVISLEFDEGVTVHLRLHESHLLSRYVGLSKATPKLGKLGSSAWLKARAAAERATLDFAGELLRLQAERETSPGHACAPDHPWLRDFEDAFIHEETRDQKQAIEDAKRDMEKPLAMDRLLCGDVGFGKTEVAIRAAFKMALDGKQVALMAPTTVLCQQHFQTLRDRFANYPVTVEMLSRFRTPQQKREIIKQLKEGKIDIVVGTHSLLGKDVKYKDLGLLVIDEEHRFGVRQKESLKQLKRNVDVLTMSATPIPRTLYFALVGARDLSVIETAPRDRRPIETIVKSYEPKLVQTAIEREIERGGQVFYLHNQVQTIEAVAAHLRKMMPKLNIGVGHGQMSERALEKVMTDFVSGRYDVLVCTTIIENGLDIPNCNTIIIEGADRFGLSQLYQLRGRVGRFNRQAYCYLLLHRHGRLLDLARKRLGAIRQFNQLGAGFRIAMRDLELRGAGNLIGLKQHGHIANVGFDLYCQLLRQSIARLKGDEHAAVIRANVKLDFVLVGRYVDEAVGGEVKIGYDALKKIDRDRDAVEKVEAFLPEVYLPEARLRIDFYRRLALASRPEAVAEIGEELQDRFGKLPAEVKTLLLLTEIRVWAERCGFSTVETEGNKLKCKYARKKASEFLLIGNRFPRLTGRDAITRMREILTFLKRQEPNLT
ncbi:transcription-repair coupling factor [Cerasicoccus fimbriatus]|uniref:transcription-repair coupling factor n=1 Tax=Cerasicoccus fimbriatus TaxID=3014554 RepID=UPI0022B42B30|nr:transcription-repair coupling factor [Cerasicoccus sp. TK19100]